MKISLTRDLAPLRALAAARIDAEAETERGRYATAGALQSMTYQSKASEARMLLAGAAGEYPLLEAEAAATGVAVADLAATVAATADRWTTITAAIEAKRMAAKKAIREAQTPAEIDCVVVDWTIG